jgi:nucleoside-diphosphate-sugar epimerase
MAVAGGTGTLGGHLVGRLTGHGIPSSDERAGRRGMSEQKNREVLEALFSDGKLKLSLEQEPDARAEDYVMEMPQSGERPNLPGRSSSKGRRRLEGPRV